MNGVVQDTYGYFVAMKWEFTIELKKNLLKMFIRIVTYLLHTNNLKYTDELQSPFLRFKFIILYYWTFLIKRLNK